MARPRRRADTGGDELESAFAVKVENLLTLYGWRWYHTHDSRRSPAGFPDYVAVREAELLFIELKAERGRLRPAQAEWLEDLGWLSAALAILIGPEARKLDPPAAAGVSVYIWRPSDLNAINDRLSRGRHRLEYAG